MNMTEYRWIYIIVAIVTGLIIADEIAYNLWKKTNPGAIWSGVKGQVAPLNDPHNPPSTW